jgi:hypothetical protein
VVFLYLNSVETHALNDLEKAVPYLICLISHSAEIDKCYDLGQALFVNQATVIAILIMLSLAGIQVFILLVRTSMFTGWYDLVRSRFGSKREFVSLDALQNTTEVRDTANLRDRKDMQDTADARNYELSKITSPSLKSPPSAFTSPVVETNPYRRSITGTPDYFTKEAEREYRSPSNSFSTPFVRSPAATHVEWDPRSTHARGGLGLHPVDDDDDEETYKWDKV